MACVKIKNKLNTEARKMKKNSKFPELSSKNSMLMNIYIFGSKNFKICTIIQTIS